MQEARLISIRSWSPSSSFQSILNSAIHREYGWEDARSEQLSRVESNSLVRTVWFKWCTLTRLMSIVVIVRWCLFQSSLTISPDSIKSATIHSSKNMSCQPLRSSGFQWSIFLINVRNFFLSAPERRCSQLSRLIPGIATSCIHFPRWRG